MVAPKPSAISGMTPQERKAAADAARLRAKDARIAELETQLREAHRRLGEERWEPRKDEDGFPRVPVHLSDLTGPQGNVYSVIGNCKRSLKQCADTGMPINPKAIATVTLYTERSYGQTIDLIDTYFDDLDGSIANLRRHEQALQMDIDAEW